MAKNLKETLLSALKNGPEVLAQNKVLRDLATDKIPSYNLADNIIKQLHAKELTLQINEIIDTGKRAKIFRFTGTDGYLPPFEAGQYINIFVQIGDARVSRPYSISSSPKERAYYELTIAAVKDGFVSGYMLEQAKVGDLITATSPAGNFHYQPVFHRPKSLFLAGGSGITPFLSMIRETLDAGHDRDIVLLYGSSTAASALYHEEFLAYQAKHPNFRYELIISGNDPDWEGERGFMDGPMIRRLVPDFNERTSYICGPQIMNAFCHQELKLLGIKPQHIRREMFGAANDITLEKGWPKTHKGTEVYKVKVNGVEIEARCNEPLLVAFERAKIQVKSSCRAGECSLCRAQIIDGDVFLAQGALMRQADRKYHYVHTCKAYPLSNLEVLV